MMNVQKDWISVAGRGLKALCCFARFQQKAGALIGLGLAFILCTSQASVGAQTVLSNEQIFSYKALDRSSWLLERAKKEGTLTLYTSLAPTEAIPLTKEFERKYGIRVEVWRGLSEGVLQRVLNESRAKRFSADVIETNGPEMEILAKERMFLEFYSPHQVDLPSGMIPKHRLWMPDRLNFFVVAFNTQKVKREELPAHLEGFLNPKWKDKLGLEATDAEWMGGVMNALGESRGSVFFKKLSEMKPDVRKGHILLAQMIASGEIEVGLTVYNANAQSLKQRGAAIDWLPIEPTLARPQGVALMKNAPHPYSAALFADFVLSPEAQHMFNQMGRPPASKLIKTELNNFNYVLTDPALVVEESEKWAQQWAKLFLVK
ncbi:MAG: extracellular solute-binding protein [Betaproteobacteria bacterium]|jgi:iron(III) transport system substrate-binding protein